MKRLVIEIKQNELDLFNRFKAKASLEGKSMRDVLIELITRYLLSKE